MAALECQLDEFRKGLFVAKHFSVDARTIMALGRDSIRDKTTAVLELVKNSYDAGANIVRIEIDNKSKEFPTGRIRVTDNGCGMTETDVEEKWLRIGYSEKRTKKRSGKRRRVGEKGIGRLSADRLGGHLAIRSQARSESPIGLTVAWSKFERSGTDIGQVPIDVIDNVAFEVPAQSDNGFSSAENGERTTGTEILITKLRETWNKEDVADLHRELSILTPAFHSTVDFTIDIRTSVTSEWNGHVVSPFHHAAEIEATFVFDPEDNSINCEFTFPKDPKRNPKPFDEPWLEFVHLPPDEVQKIDIGDVEIRFFYFLRQGSSVKDLDITLTELRAFLDNQAGIRVYRDAIRVVPYGDMKKSEGGDWLGLGDRKSRNPAGAGRADFRLAPNQLVGAVFLTRDRNPGLVDTSGREGLVHGRHFDQLKQLLMGCVMSLENQYRKLFKSKSAAATERIAPRRVIQEFSVGLKKLRKGLDGIQADLPTKTRRDIDQVRDQIDTTVSDVADVEKSIEELASQATTYRGIASIGIAAATFGHETESSLTQFRTSIITAKTILDHGGEDSDALDEIEKALSAAKRVSAWGQFAIRRIKPDKRTRKKQRIEKIIGQLIEELQPIFLASNIKLTSRLSDIEGRCFPMDVESIVLNFLTNAYFFSKLSKRPRKVVATLKKKRHDGKDGFEIAVSDTGPGVAKKLRDEIWDPLVSSKVDTRGKQIGTGLGLSIVDDVVHESNGHREVGKDEKLLGARFSAWLPLI